MKVGIVMELKLPKTKNAKEKFSRIIEAADTEFYEKGFENTTIASITSRAGMAVGTFYLYFKDKLSLYHYILFDYQDRLKRYIQARIGNCDNRQEKEKLGLIAWLEFINENPRTYNIIWQSLIIDKKLEEFELEDYEDIGYELEEYEVIPYKLDLESATL